MIADRSGVWSGVEKWEWLVGFYPGGSEQHQCGVADSFEAARAASSDLHRSRFSGMARSTGLGEETQSAPEPDQAISPTASR